MRCACGHDDETCDRPEPFRPAPANTTSGKPPMADPALRQFGPTRNAKGAE